MIPIVSEYDENKEKTMPRFIDLTGKRFERLTVIELMYRYVGRRVQYFARHPVV